MVLERASTATFIDVLDRVLDKGIVIDSWMRVALAGLNLLEIEGRFVVASINTYVTRADSIALALGTCDPSPLALKPELHSQPTKTIRQVRRKSSNRPNRVA
jgi:gas vesicle structural protein